MNLLRALVLTLSLSAIYGIPYYTVIDPISGRPGNVPTTGATSRRSLAGSNCGAFTACPSASAAAQAVVGNNPDLTIVNAVFSKGTCIAGKTQWGLVPGSSWTSGHPMAAWFTNGALVLSSGDAAAGNCGLNTLDHYTLLVGGGGDSNLNALVPAYTTYDAVALEFNVTANKDGVLVFKYAFGSDEYTEWVGTAFNDVFGFFIAPSGQPFTSGNNVAIVKGTQTQVSINNVNPKSNSALYINNRIGAVNPLAPIEADGYTQLLTTKGYQVTAGQTYQFKLAIADAGDQILDSWVWIGGQTLIVDTKPVANATVSNVTTCTNKIATLNASLSYDVDKDDSLTYNWQLSAPCYPTVTYTTQVAQVDLSTLAKNVSYTVRLIVSDKSEVDDVYQTSLFVPVGCGATLTPVCGVVLSPPPPRPPPNPPGVVKPSPPPPPPPPGPPPPPAGNYLSIMQGDVTVVQCGQGVTITAGGAANEGLAELAKNYGSPYFPVTYIWGLYDILDDGYDFPIAMKSTGANTVVTFTTLELKQGRSAKKYRVALDVTDVDTWDQGNGLIVSTESFLQVLQCPIKPATPLPVVNFTGTSNPESFTLACGTTVVLDATAPLADAVAQFGTSKPITTKTLRWTLRTGTGTVVWTYDSTTATTNLAGWPLEASGVITANTFYSLKLVIYINDKDYDNDNWETKMSVQACPKPPPGAVASSPPPRPPPPSPPPKPPPPPPPSPPVKPSPPPPTPPSPLLSTAPKPPPPMPSPPLSAKPPPPRPPSPKPPSPKPPPPPPSSAQSIVTFNGVTQPPQFSMACGASVTLNASGPVASATASFVKKFPTTPITSKLLTWSLKDAVTGVVLWKSSISTVTTTFSWSNLVTTGVIKSNVYYTLAVSVRVNDEDFDNDAWRTKVLVQACR